jgi:hypothetical protein
MRAQQLQQYLVVLTAVIGRPNSDLPMSVVLQPPEWSRLDLTVIQGSDEEETRRGQYLSSETSTWCTHFAANRPGARTSKAAATGLQFATNFTTPHPRTTLQSVTAGTAVAPRSEVQSSSLSFPREDQRPDESSRRHATGQWRGEIKEYAV